MKATGSRPCGDRGIRTPEAFRLNGFQDRRYRPLSHISAAKVQLFSFGCVFCRKKILFSRENPIFAKLKKLRFYEGAHRFLCVFVLGGNALCLLKAKVGVYRSERATS